MTHDGEWHLAVRFAQRSNRRCPIVEVSQGGKALAEPHNEEWRLISLEPLEVRAEGQVFKVPLPFVGRDVLLFRILESGRRGMLVRTLASGFYGIIAPHQWDLSTDAPMPFSPEPVAYPGYIVRFLEVPPGFTGSVALRTTSGAVIQIPRKHDVWSFVGEAAPDISPNLGPLYLGEPPKLHLRVPSHHPRAVRAVVGEEGPAPSSGRRWSTIVDLEGSGEAEDVISRALGSAPPRLQHIGWYYVRLYDDDDQLVESYDFRFARGIRDVRLVHEPWPGGAEVQPSSLSLRIEKRWLIEPVDGVRGVMVSRQDDDGVLRIEIDPSLAHDDWLSLRIRSPQGESLEWRLPLGRVVWGLADASGEPFEWTATPVYLKKDDYRPTSDRCLHIRVPETASQCRSATLLLGDEPIHGYGVGRRLVKIPLNHLFDAIASRQVPALALDVEFKPVHRRVRVAWIRRRFKCRNCSYATPDREMALEHIVEQHRNVEIQALSYGEIAKRHPHLPRGIYRCPYCGFYVRADDRLTNPNDAIALHQIQACREARAAAKGGRVKVQFSVVTDADEVRRHVENTLPKEFRCSICREVLSFPFNVDPEPDLTKHLRRHRDELARHLLMEDMDD